MTDPALLSRLLELPAGAAGPGGRVIVPAGPPLSPGFDGWAWLLTEKAYLAWRAGR